MKPKTSYKALDVEPVVAHPIDHAVYVRVGRPRLQATLAKKAQAVVDALGKRRWLWFDYEELQGRLTSLREAAYFDLGVELGVAEARQRRLRGERTVKQLAARLVREALAANVARKDASAAAVMAAWIVLGGKRATPGVQAHRTPS